MIKLTDASLALFLRLADDAGNWSGTPPTDGNVDMSTAERGNLTQLKRAKLLTTFEDGETKMTWVRFTDAGIALAAEHGRRLNH